MELICLFFIKQLGSPGGSVVKNLPANTGGMGSVPGSGRSPEEGNGDPLQYAWLGNPVDRRAWQGYRSRGRKRVGMQLSQQEGILLPETSNDLMVIYQLKPALSTTLCI